MFPFGFIQNNSSLLTICSISCLLTPCPQKYNKSSRSRSEKERAIITGQIERIESDLEKLHIACDEGHLKKIGVVERRIGRLLQRNTRAASLFEIKVSSEDRGKLCLNWYQRTERVECNLLTQGCYILRSNILNWSAEKLWQAYMHLTEAEAAFRIQKSDLALRPIWHQIAEHVQAHILVCFLAFVLWKCLAQMCKHSGLGDEPRKVIDESKQIKLTDVILPTRGGLEIKLRCVPTRSLINKFSFNI